MADFSDEQCKSQRPGNIGLVTPSATAVTVVRVANGFSTTWSDRFYPARFSNEYGTAPVLQSFLSVENSGRRLPTTVTAVRNRRAMNSNLQVKFIDQC